MAVQHTFQDGRGTQTRVITRRGAIVANCRECMGGNTAEVRRCTAPLCALFPFRSGKEVGLTCDDAQAADDGLLFDPQTPENEGF